jgi:hypothetical protein
VVSSYDCEDTSIWESVVVYTVGDYENTISWPGV